MGALRTSEDAVVVAGEGKQARASEDRSVDGEPKIVIGGDVGASTPVAQAPRTPRPAPPVPAAVVAAAAAEPRAGGLWLVILVYILASAALAAAIYERFFM